MISPQHGLALCAFWIPFLACGPPPTGPAAACAAVVKLYRGLPNPVEVVGTAEHSSGGSVEIRYESTNGENIPVIGKAVCEFAAGDGGALRLVFGQVDGAELDASTIASVNRSNLRALRVQ